MKYSIDDIKIKHLELISSKEVDFPFIMKDVFGYKNTWIDKIFLFRYKFKKIYSVLKHMRTINISKLDDVENCSIRYPRDIDSISFQARLEIKMIKGKDNIPITEKIINTVALACFETHFDRSFDSDSKLFIKFKKVISNKPLLEIMSLFNVIDTSISKSDKFWNEMFLKMQITDKHFEQVGGSVIMKQFSLPKLIKKGIKDYNCSYEEVFLKPYSLLQYNSLELAAENWIQDQIRQLKEREFKAARSST